MKNIVIILSALILVGGAVWYFSHGKVGQQNTREVTEITPSPTIEAAPKEATPSMPLTQPTKATSWNSPPPMTVDPNKTYSATMVTSKGTLKLNLFVSENPIAVNNFVFLSRQGFYNGTFFHRIIKGFMIQGGDPTGTGAGSPGYRFNDEPITRDYKRGTIAMANSGPNTNGSQFFIMHADYALPKNYVIFGAIDASDTASLTTLDAIANTPVTMSDTGEQSKPTEKITIQSVTIEEL